MSENFVVVIGAANIDIGGASYAPPVHGDSNPGSISISYGGVARNIAHNLSSLGVDVRLISYMGVDLFGEGLLNHCKKIGLNVDNVIIDSEDSSSMYLYINNDKGDMELAISQVKLEDKLTPAYLRKCSDIISNSSLTVVDANLSQEAFLELKDICREAGVPICVDPVSIAQARKIKGHLEGVDYIKPNRLEAEFLTDMTIQREADYRAAADEFLSQGVKHIFMSMGPNGMMAADKDNKFIVGECPADVLCTTGAGDSATAAIVWSLMIISNINDDNLKDENYLITASKAANAIASLTTEVIETNHPGLNNDLALMRMRDNNMIIKKL